MESDHPVNEQNTASQPVNRRVYIYRLEASPQIPPFVELRARL